MAGGGASGHAAAWAAIRGNLARSRGGRAGSLGQVSDEENPGQEGGRPTRVSDPWERTDATEQMRVRLAKVERLKAAGIEPYPVGYPRTDTIAAVKSRHADLPADSATGDRVGVTGRVMLYRTGGKLSFATI